jgi:hypothetical protein
MSYGPKTQSDEDAENPYRVLCASAVRCYFELLRTVFPMRPASKMELFSTARHTFYPSRLRHAGETLWGISFDKLFVHNPLSNAGAFWE